MHSSLNLNHYIPSHATRYSFATSTHKQTRLKKNGDDSSSCCLPSLASLLCLPLTLLLPSIPPLFSTSCSTSRIRLCKAFFIGVLMLGSAQWVFTVFSNQANQPLFVVNSTIATQNIQNNKQHHLAHKKQQQPQVPSNKLVYNKAVISQQIDQKPKKKNQGGKSNKWFPSAPLHSPRRHLSNASVQAWRPPEGVGGKNNDGKSDKLEGGSSLAHRKVFSKQLPIAKDIQNGEHKGSREDDGLKICPPVPHNLDGPVQVSVSSPSMEGLESHHPELEPGGKFRPSDCHARHKVAVIIPFRDRAAHLAIFLNNIHPFLQKQQIDYAIYIVEQAGSGKFNRAMLMNVGSLEALKLYPYDCFVFHDVDLLPEDDRNLYTCPEQPRHMSVAINTMKYRLPYNDIFGGVSAMTVAHFRRVNGFSNKFWGWGGEDDDMSNRIKFHNLFVSRYPANIARYTMLSHKKDHPNPHRYKYLYEGRKRFNSDGLNTCRYKVIDVQLRRLYTWVYVELIPS